MESDTITSDFLIQQLGGCGIFQLIFSALIFLPHISAPFSTLLMSFGSYNPGWRCLDNTTNHFDNSTVIQIDDVNNNGGLNGHQNDNTSDDYAMHSCQVFSACQNVQFDPEVSTVVTEWGLICDKAWVVPLIMTVQMSGGLAGGLLIGYVGDKFGRKFTLYTHLPFHCALTLASRFSVSWQMLAILQFFTAACHPTLTVLPIAYMTEFVPPKFRIIVGSIPMWAVGSFLYAVSTMLTRSWKQICIILVLIDFACFLPVIWVPESFRWLAVNNKKKDYFKTGKKIARLNRSNLNEDHCQELIERENEKIKNKSRYGVLDLFRKGYTHIAIIMGYTFISLNMNYYVALLGVAYLPGNIYSKMMITTASELPANVIAAFVPNYIGRRKSISGSLTTTSLCLVGAVLTNHFLTDDDEARSICVMTLLIVGKCLAVVAWCISVVFLSELYPTVVRTSASGYGGLMGVVGSLLAPFLIPTDESKMFTRNYSILTGLALSSGLSVLLLPETKGKPMKDTFENSSRKCANRLVEKGKYDVARDDEDEVVVGL